MKRAMAVLALGAFSLISLVGQKKPEWKDRAEYDLYESITKEANAQTKIGLLDQWKQKYPTSEFGDVRGKLFIDTYRQLGDGKKMMAAAKDMTAAYPEDIYPLYWMNLLTISLNDNTADALDTGEKAAKGLLAILDKVYDPAKKPANVTEDAFKKDRDNTESLAHRTLGWVAMQRQQWEAAENSFNNVLKKNPSDAQVSSWLGTVILRQRKVEKQAKGLYSIARAAVYEGQGALPPETRKSLLAFIEKSYINYHGDRAGLDDILNKAKTEALPPDDIKIESKDEILAKQEEELKKSNPQLALWVSIKRELTGANSTNYWNEMKGTAIPSGVEVGGTKVEKLKGKIVSTKAGKPKGVKEIVVGISSPDMSEVTLRFESPLNITVDPGTEVEFEGVPAEFQPDPFNVTFDVEPEKVTGLPKPATPPAKKAPAAPAKKAPAAPAKK